MNFLSLDFVLFSLAAVFLINSQKNKYRSGVFLLFNLIFLSTFIGSFSTLIALLAFLAWGYLFCCILLSRWRARYHTFFFILSIGGLLVSFVLFKKYKILEFMFSPGRFPLNHNIQIVGLSYMLFRVIHLMIECWERRGVKLNVFSYLNYLIGFHMLLAGPIQRYSSFYEQHARCPSLGERESWAAINRILNGFIKKFILAEQVHILFSYFLTNHDAHPFFYSWLYAYAYFIFTYLDFSGYCDIVIGLGYYIGIIPPENFNHPLAARNIFDFWNRWHMSFYEWIRDYLFNPLLKFIMTMLKGKYLLMAACLSYMFTLVLSGLWHGTEVRCIVWGAYHGIGMIICKLYELFLRKHLGQRRFKEYLANKWIRLGSTFVTFQFVSVSFLIFSLDVGRSKLFLRAMFGM